MSVVFYESWVDSRKRNGIWRRTFEKNGHGLVSVGMYGLSLLGQRIGGCSSRLGARNKEIPCRTCEDFEKHVVTMVLH